MLPLQATSAAPRRLANTEAATVRGSGGRSEDCTWRPVHVSRQPRWRAHSQNVIDALAVARVFPLRGVATAAVTEGVPNLRSTSTDNNCPLGSLRWATAGLSGDASWPKCGAGASRGCARESLHRRQQSGRSGHSADSTTRDGRVAANQRDGRRQRLSPAGRRHCPRPCPEPNCPSTPHDCRHRRSSATSTSDKCISHGHIRPEQTKAVNTPTDIGMYRDAFSDLRFDVKLQIATASTCCRRTGTTSWVNRRPVTKVRW